MEYAPSKLGAYHSNLHPFPFSGGQMVPGTEKGTEKAALRAETPPEASNMQQEARVPKIR